MLSFAEAFLPDVHSRPLFNPSSGADWTVVLLAPASTLFLATHMALRQYKGALAQTIRYTLLPVGLWALTRAATSYDYTLHRDPKYNPWNYAAGLIAFAYGMKLTQVTFIRRRPERLVGAGPATVPTTGTLYEVVDFLGDPREIRYQCKEKRAGRPEKAPLKPVDRSTFMREQFVSAVVHVVLFDFCQTVFQSVPWTTIGTPQGGSIYVESLPPWQRYMLSTVICWNMGMGVYAGLQYGANMVALIGVGVFGVDPMFYPPMFNAPWLATSVQELWMRWHALFQKLFLALAAPVGGALLGLPGTVLAIFILSGLLHDWTIWGMGKGIDTVRIVGFFFLHGVGMILENVWTRTTGYKVRGALGCLWLWILNTAAAHLITQAWLERGIGGGVYFLPDNLRPFYQLRNLILGSN